MVDDLLAVLAIVLGLALIAGCRYLGARMTEGQDERAPQLMERARQARSAWERALLGSRGRRSLNAFGFALLGAMFVVLGLGRLAGV
jgi:hypothetical protein